MSSFDQLLAQAQNEKYFERIASALLQTIMKRPTIDLANKIQPFLQHANDGHLNSLYTQLQNPFNDNGIYKGLVHNVVIASKTNEKLKRLLEVLISP
jgi:hypothetical protein